MRQPSLGDMGALARAASTITCQGNECDPYARRRLKILLLRAYNRWCREEPDKPGQPDGRFKRDGMVLRFIPPEERT